MIAENYPAWGHAPRLRQPYGLGGTEPFLSLIAVLVWSDEPVFTALASASIRLIPASNFLLVSSDWSVVS
jgi:hypothetical protein